MTINFHLYQSPIRGSGKTHMMLSHLSKADKNFWFDSHGHQSFLANKRTAFDLGFDISKFKHLQGERSDQYILRGYNLNRVNIVMHQIDSISDNVMDFICVAGYASKEVNVYIESERMVIIPMRLPDVKINDYSDFLYGGRLYAPNPDIEALQSRLKSYL